MTFVPANPTNPYNSEKPFVASEKIKVKITDLEGKLGIKSAYWKVCMSAHVFHTVGLRAEHMTTICVSIIGLMHVRTCDNSLMHVRICVPMRTDCKVRGACMHLYPPSKILCTLLSSLAIQQAVGIM